MSPKDVREVEGAEMDSPPDGIDVFKDYSQNDIDYLANIILGSKRAECAQVILALIQAKQDGTLDSFEFAQDLLKKAFLEELVGKTSGGLNSVNNRLAVVLFQSKEGRIILNDDELPVFRSGPEDGSKVSASDAAVSVILENSDEYMKGETPESRSMRLFKEVIGEGGEGEVLSLVQLAALTRSIYANLDEKKAKSVEKFETDAKGTSEEELLQKKTKLEEEITRINENISSKEEDRCNEEEKLDKIDEAFGNLLENSDFASDLPSIEEMLGEDVSPTNVSAVYQTVLEQFSRLAEQEKRQSTQQGIQEELQAQLTRLEEMKARNIEDRDTIKSNVSVLEGNIEEYNQEIQLASDNKIVADNRIKSLQNDFDIYMEKYNVLSDLQRYALDSILSMTTTVDQNNIDKIGAYVNTSSLQSAANAYSQACNQVFEADKALNAAKGVLVTSEIRRKATLSSLEDAKQATIVKKRIMDNVHPKYFTGGFGGIYGGSYGQTTPNPAFIKAQAEYSSAVTHQSLCQIQYNTALQAAKNAEKSLANKEKDLEGKKKTKDTVRDTFDNEARKVGGELDTLANEALNAANTAEEMKVQAETDSKSCQLRIDSATEGKESDLELLSTAQENLLDKENFIKMLEEQILSMKTQIENDIKNSSNPTLKVTPMDSSSEAVMSNNITDLTVPSTEYYIPKNVRDVSVDLNLGSEWECEQIYIQLWYYTIVESIRVGVGSDYGWTWHDIDTTDALNEELTLDFSNLVGKYIKVMIRGGYMLDADWGLREIKISGRLDGNAISTKDLNFNVSTITDNEVDPAETEDQIQDLLRQRKTVTEAIGACTIRLTQLRSSKSKAQNDLEDIDMELSASPEAREDRRLQAQLVKNASIRDAINDASQQLATILMTAGYSQFSTWSGRPNETKSEALLRLLIADHKELSRPVQVRTRAPLTQYEQITGNQIRQSDIQDVEEVVAKLQDKVGTIDESDPKNVLQHVETLVRLEFNDDLSVKPSDSILVNDCDLKDNVAWKERTVLNPSSNMTQRLILKVEALYDTNEGSCDWILLRPLSSKSKTPIEDTVRDLVTFSLQDWSLDASGMYLINSWLKTKTLEEASIEDLGNLVGRFEYFQENKEEALSELNIFRDSTYSVNDDVTQQITKWTIHKFLSLSDRIFEEEKNFVSATEMDVVTMAASSRLSINKFSKGLGVHAMNLLCKEIQKRKGAIMSGAIGDVGGAAADEASMIEDQIRAKEDEIKAAEDQLDELKQNLDVLIADAEANINTFDRCKNELEEEISTLEQELETQEKILEEKLIEHQATEDEIMNDLQNADDLRDKLDELYAQQENLEDQLDAARNAADKAKQDVIDAEGEVEKLKVQLENLQSLKDAATAKRDGLIAWRDFMRDVSYCLTETRDGILNRQELTQGFKNVEDSSNPHGEMFSLLGHFFPSLKTEADKFSITAYALQKLDLRQALHQSLLDYPSLHYTPATSILPGVLTVQGTSISYSEVEKKILDFVTQRCIFAGLYFDNNDVMYARSESVSKISELPSALKKLIENRIKLYYPPDMTRGENRAWDEYLNRQYEGVSKMLLEMKGWCGITKWDVVRSLVKTVEVDVGQTFIVDKKIVLPGINFFVTAGKNIEVCSGCTIDTSPPQSIQFYDKKARNGESYISNPSPGGVSGDNGAKGPAGMNAGHVTLNAYNNLIFDDDILYVSAIGAVGVDGQQGGDGDQGQNGIDTGSASPEGTDGMEARQVSIGWTRYPGCEQNGNPDPQKVSELSGRGGNGGDGGVGGQGGGGGEVYLIDKDHQTVKIFPASRNNNYTDDVPADQQDLFGDKCIIVSSYDGKDGISSAGGRGGEGGVPGQRGIEKVRNKTSFWKKTKVKTGYIDKNWQSGLKYSGSNVTEVETSWGKSVYLDGNSYRKSDFNDRIHPWMSASDEEEAKTSSKSRGSPGGAGHQTNETETDEKQEKREENNNISSSAEYQQQKYGAIGGLNNENEFSKADNQYNAEEESLNQQIGAINGQISSTENEIQQAEKVLSEMKEQEEEASKKEDEIQEEINSINNMVDKTTDEITETEMATMSKILASFEQTQEISQIKQEIQNISIDQKYDSQAISKLQSLAFAVQAVEQQKQEELRAEIVKVEQTIESLNAEKSMMEQKKSEMANVNAIGALDSLMQRSQEMQKETTSQQQKESTSIEADNFDESIEKNDDSFTLTLRRSFSRSDTDESVWAELEVSSSATEKVKEILDAISSIGEDKRVQTVEYLEILIRYCLFTNKLAVLEEMPSVCDSNTVDEIVVNTLMTVHDNLCFDDLFVGSIAGYSLMVTSYNNITVDEASLTSRYDEIEGITLSESLTKDELHAAELIKELKTTGPNFQHIAQFIKMYSNLLTEVVLLSRPGYLALLEGRPVKVLDKISRTILMFLQRSDDILAAENLELAIGIARIINDIIRIIDIRMIQSALKRESDLRDGKGGYTHLFLKNSVTAADLMELGDKCGALSAMRRNKETSTEAAKKVPMTFEALISEIDTISSSQSIVYVESTMTAIGRSLASAYIPGSTEEILQLLNKLESITFSDRENSDLFTSVYEDTLRAIPAIATGMLATLFSQGDRAMEEILINAATSRHGVPNVPVVERIARVVAFFNFIYSDITAISLPESELDDDCISNDEAQKNMIKSILQSNPLAYPERTIANMRFLGSIGFDGEYEDAVERTAFAIIVAHPNFIDIVPFQVEGMIESILKVTDDEITLLETLVPLAMESCTGITEISLDMQLLAEASVSMDSIRNVVDFEFRYFPKTEQFIKKKESIISSCIDRLDMSRTFTLWDQAVSSVKIDDLVTICLSVIRSGTDRSIGQQLQGAQYLWENLPIINDELKPLLGILFEGTSSIVDAATGNILNVLGFFPTIHTIHIRDLLEGALPILARELASFPDESTISNYALHLSVVLNINLLMQDNLEKKESVGHLKQTAEKSGAYVEVDMDTKTELLTACMQFSLPEVHIGNADISMLNDISNSLISDKDNLIRTKIEFARFLYFVVISDLPDSSKTSAITESGLNFVVHLLDQWRCESDSNARTISLALLNLMVLHVRFLEQEIILNKFAENFESQQILLEEKRKLLPSTTTSTEDEGVSNALISENKRRLQLWQICINQINDIGMYHSDFNWDQLFVDLQECPDSDEFEQALAENVNNLLYSNRSRNQSDDIIPPSLVEETREEWAVDNWGILEKAIDIWRYSTDIQLFDFNELLESMIEALASILPLSDVDDVSFEESVSRGDSIAWILNKISDAYQGMYLVSNDSELVSKLLVTVEDISFRATSSSVSAKFVTAADRIATVLEQTYPRKGRYAQVSDIIEATYEKSSIKQRLDAVDIKASMTSASILKALDINDFLHDKVQDSVVQNVEQIIQVREFGSIPEDWTDQLNLELIPCTEDDVKLQSLKALVSITKGKTDIFTSFETLSDLALNLGDASLNVQGLLKSAYAASLRVFASSLHFTMGMAKESKFSIEKGTPDQLESTKQEYFAAAKEGNSAAYNNLLCNAFFEIRKMNIGFDLARNEVMPGFKDIFDSDPKAAENFQLLEDGESPTESYAFQSPVGDQVDDEQNTIFCKFEDTVKKIVVFLEEVISAICSCSQPILNLRHILGTRVDALYKKLNSDMINMQDITTNLENFYSETIELLKSAPAFLTNDLSDFSSVLEEIFSISDSSDLSSLEDYISLVPVLGGFCPEDVRAVLFSGKGSSIFYNEIAMANSSIIALLIEILPKIVAIEEREEETANFTFKTREGIRKRLMNKSLENLAKMQESADSGSYDLHLIQLMLDACLFEEEDLLLAAGVEVKDLLTEEEQCMASIIGSQSTFEATHLDSDDSVLRSPAEWRDELNKRSLRQLISQYAFENIVYNTLGDLKKAFWSPYDPIDSQEPLQLAEKEVDKIVQATKIIIDQVDNFDTIEKQYQNIFNAGHYILRLITPEYIMEVRYPEEEGDKYMERYEQSTSLANAISVVTEKVLRMFTISKECQERLIILEHFFFEDTAHVYALLHGIKMKDLAAFSNLLWLLEVETTDEAKTCIERVLSTSNDMEPLSNIFIFSVFDLLETEVNKLCEILKLSSLEKVSALRKVAVLRHQNLSIAKGSEFMILLLSIAKRMIRDANQDKPTKSASREEFDALMNVLKLSVQGQVWRSSSLLKQLELQINPSRWVPLLESFTISISLGYDPEQTNKEDSSRYKEISSAIQRLKSRRGALLSENFVQCLKLLVSNGIETSSLGKITSSVASNLWSFSLADKPSYEYAASLMTSDAMVSYLQEKEDEKTQNAGERSYPRLVEVMREEIDSVNTSVATLLSFKENETLSNVEVQIVEIERLKETHLNSNGKPIKVWEKDDIIAWSKEFQKESRNCFNEENIDKMNIMLAIFVRSVTVVFGYPGPRKPQLLAIIMFVDSMIVNEGRLGEIGTGEGKSIIAALCAVACVFKNQTVDVITSSQVLAERDSAEARMFLECFGMTVSNNCDNDAEADPAVRKKRYQENAVIYGTTGAFQRDILLTKYYGKDIREKVGNCLIVDEVDSLFIDCVANTLYISHDIQDLKYLNDIFVSIWMGVNGCDVSVYSESNVALVKLFIEQQMEKGNIFVPNWLDKFARNRMDMWIRNAYNAKTMQEGDQYTLYDTGQKRGQICVIDLYTGIEMTSTQWSNGLHQFIQLKHNNKLSPESLKAIFVANVNFVKMYGSRIIGMTGTLGADAEFGLLKNVYGVRTFRMPRYMEPRYFEDIPVVVGNRARWLELVASEVEVQSTFSTGFDIEGARNDLENQAKSIEKYEGRVDQAKKDISDLESGISQSERHKSDLLTMKMRFSNADDVNERALEEFDALISLLEGSEFMNSESNGMGNKCLEDLSLTISNMRDHFVSIENAKAESERILRIIENLQLELKDPSNLSDPEKIQELQLDLSNAKNERASVEDNLLKLQGQTSDKANEVLTSLSTLQESLSSFFDAYLDRQMTKLEDAKKYLEESEAKLAAAEVNYASSNDAINAGMGGRAVLVICRNTNDAENICDTLVSRGTMQKLYIYTGTLTGINEMNPATGEIIRTGIDLGTLSPHDVVVATNIAGRGTSFNTTEVLEQCGGLHVVLSYVPGNIRVEVQAWGRTSRQGKKGSGRFVVYDPRVSTSEDVIDIDYILSERDVLERERLDIIEVETIPRVEMENILFHEFEKISTELEKVYKLSVDPELQQKELRDKWAFFLESQNEELESYYEHPQESEEKLLSALEYFKEEQFRLAERTFGIISSPGNLLHIVSKALTYENFSQAKAATQMIIDTDRQFAAYGYYYHALSLFGSGTNNHRVKQNAIDELKKAVYLFNRQTDQLGGNSQVVATVNGVIQDSGIGTNSKDFETSNSNIQSLLQVHINSAEKTTGRPLQYYDFDTSAINGDATEQVYNVLNDCEDLRPYISPRRITPNIEIWLRIEANDRSAVNFLSESRQGNSQIIRWVENTLEIRNITDEEMTIVKTLNLAWELALYREGNEFENNRQIRVIFPSSLQYAVPVMLENLRKISQDINGNPIPFRELEEAKRAKVAEMFYGAIITKDEIRSHLEGLAVSIEPAEFLTIDDDYKKKSLGKWDSVGFCGIGDSMKSWILEQAEKRKNIPKEEVLSEARKQLQSVSINNDEGKAQSVVNSIVSKGIAEIQTMHEMKQENHDVIINHLNIIALKDISDSEINSIDFQGFDFLERNSLKVKEKLKEFKGNLFSSDSFYDMFSEDEVAEALNNSSFSILQGLTQSLGIASGLCERLGLTDIEDFKREEFDNILVGIETIIFDINSILEEAGSSSELEGNLINQQVLEMAKVNIGIDGKKDLNSLTKLMKTHLENPVKEIAKNFLGEGEGLEDKTKAMKDDIIEAVLGSVTELASAEFSGAVLQAKKLNLTDCLEDDNVPPELREFIDSASETVFKLKKKKNFWDYWDWGAFVVAMLGVLQVIAGAAILVLSCGVLTNIAGAFIGEGVGDMIYATTAGLTGTFSWKDYGIQKAISVAMTIGMGLVSCGVSSVVFRSAAATAAVGTKVVISTVVRSVAKKVTMEMIKGIAEFGVGIAAEKLTSLATKELFRTFKSNFQEMAESNPGARQSVQDIKNTLRILLDCYGADQTLKYLNDATSDSCIAADKSGLNNELASTLCGVASTLGSELGDLGERLSSSKNSLSKVLSIASQCIGYVVNAAPVLDSMQRVVQFVPRMYNKLNDRLLSISTSPSTSNMTEQEKDIWIERNMVNVSNSIHGAVEEMVEENITGVLFQQALSVGMDKFNKSTIDKMGNQYDDMMDSGLGSIGQQNSNGGSYSGGKNDQGNLNEKPTDPKDNFPSISNPVKSTDKLEKVEHNGQTVTIGTITRIFGTKSLRAIPNSLGTQAPILVRPKFEDYVEALTINKQATLFDVKIMAKTQKVNVSLTYKEDGRDYVFNINQSRDRGVATLRMKLLSGPEYPRGKYVTVDSRGGILHEGKFQDIGNSSAAQQFLYSKYANDPDEGLKQANSGDALKSFYQNVRNYAKNDNDLSENSLKSEYNRANFDNDGYLLGEQIPEPLPTVPDPHSLQVKDIPSPKMSEPRIAPSKPETTVLARAITGLKQHVNDVISAGPLSQSETKGRVIVLLSDNLMVDLFNINKTGNMQKPSMSSSRLAVIETALRELNLPSELSQKLQFVVVDKANSITDSTKAVEQQALETRYIFSIDEKGAISNSIQEVWKF